MKYLLILADGLADYKIAELGARPLGIRSNT